MLTPLMPPAVLEYGSCVGQDPRLWDSDSPDKLTWQGQRICASCPVRVVCLTWAQEHAECGVWGGVLFSSTGAYARRERLPRGAQTAQSMRGA